MQMYKKIRKFSQEVYRGLCKVPMGQNVYEIVALFLRYQPFHQNRLLGHMTLEDHTRRFCQHLHPAGIWMKIFFLFFNLSNICLSCLHYEICNIHVLF